jgi:hypothetical protein
MFATGQNQPFKSTVYALHRFQRPRRWIVTMLAKKDVQDLEVSDGMVSILRGSVHALSCSV